jgi:hypothetical protein
LANKTFVPIPRSTIRLFKRSVYTDRIETDPDENSCEQARLLKERGTDGAVHRTTSIDLRVGCWWDGGVISYVDGHKSHWGPLRTRGRGHRFGGHASQTITLPPNINIKRIDVNRGSGDHYTQGMRMRLVDRTVCGEFNARSSSDADVTRLQPASHEVIVGFYGKNGKSGGVIEFGILTAAKSAGLDGLPDAVFDLPDLRNTIRMGDNEQTTGQSDSDEERDYEDDDHIINGDE